MRALILSDIHANLPALEAVLAAAPAHDAVWNLGDTVGYGASPAEAIARVQALGSIFVRGNHDRACSGLASLEDFNPIAREAAAWTGGRLSNEQRAWLRALPQGPVHAASDVICVHGSAADEDAYVLALPEAIDALQAGADAWIQFFGHTHVQGGYVRSDDSWYELTPDYATRDDPEHNEVQLRRGMRYLLNPGSVGQPRDGDWRTAFALYDDEAATVRFYRVPYDVERAMAMIRDARLPDRLAARLSEGR